MWDRLFFYPIYFGKKGSFTPNMFKYSVGSIPNLFSIMTFWQVRKAFSIVHIKEKPLKGFFFYIIYPFLS